MERMIERVLKNAAYAANQWENTCAGCDKIKNNFHWRAADKDITLVIHNDTKPMNGIHCNTYRDGKKSAFKTVLNEIKNHPGNLDIDFLKELGFTAGNSAEDVIQARFISDLIKNKKENFTWLLNQLKETQLYFLGSEIILFEGNDPSRERIDVVAAGEKAIYIIEMKDISNSKDNPITQVNGYLKYYSGKRHEQFLKLMLEYANSYGINLKNINLPLKGVTIKGYKPKNMVFKKDGEIFTFSEN